MKDTPEFLINNPEFLIDVGSPYEGYALAKLFEEMITFLSDHPGRAWKWRKEPETQQDASSGKWKAYARIELL